MSEKLVDIVTVLLAVPHGSDGWMDLMSNTRDDNHPTLLEWTKSAAPTRSVSVQEAAKLFESPPEVFEESLDRLLVPKLRGHTHELTGSLERSHITLFGVGLGVCKPENTSTHPWVCGCVDEDFIVERHVRFPQSKNELTIAIVRTSGRGWGGWVVLKNPAGEELLRLDSPRRIKHRGFWGGDYVGDSWKSAEELLGVLTKDIANCISLYVQTPIPDGA